MTTTTRTNETPKPVTGTVRWLRPLIHGKQLGRLAIGNANGKVEEYDVGYLAGADGQPTGLGLAKDDDQVYAIEPTIGGGQRCSCNDCQYRNRECKHIRAARAALVRAGLALPTLETRQATVRGGRKAEMADF